MGSFSPSLQPRILFVALVAGLLLRVLFVLTNQTPPISDEADYDKLGRTIAFSGDYALDGVPTAYRPPGYPSFLALSYLLFGPSTLAAKIIQALLDTLTAYLLFCIGRTRSERIGLMTTILWLVFVPAVLYVNLLLAESVTAFLLVASMLMFLRIGPESRIPRLIGFGLLTGACALVKPGLLLIPLLLVSFSTLISLRPREFIFILLGFSVITLPWMIRNDLVLDTFSLSTNTGMNLYIGNNPTATGAYRGDFPEILTDPSLTEATRNQKAMSEAKEYILSHPGTFLINGMKKLIHLFRSEGDVLIAAFPPHSPGLETGFKENYRSVPLPITLLTNIVAFTILFGGIVGFATGERNRQFWFTLSVLVALLGTHFVFFGGSRFHFILMPFAVLYSAEALDSCFRKEMILTNRQKILLVMTLVALLAIWSYELLIVFTSN